MKKLMFMLLLLFICGSCTYAEETITDNAEAIQETDIDASGIVGIINKQPKTNGIVQKVKVRRSGIIFIININGKVQVKDNPEK